MTEEKQSEWIEWAGGECPVRLDAVVTYKLRNGDICIPQRASQLDWSHNGTWNDIIAYRLASTDRELEA
jgi:hypothetical protein